MRVPNNFRRLLLIAVAALAVFLALYAFRASDDNRLSSWQWTLGGANIAAVCLFLITGSAISYLTACIAWPQRRTLILLVILSFCGAALFWNAPNFLLDSSRYFAQAKYLELYGIEYFLREWGREIAVWTDLPAVPFLFGLLFKLCGESRLVVQIVTTSLFALTVVLTAWIGKALWDEETGVQAGALLLGIPYLITQTPLMAVDIPTMFLLTLSVFAVIRTLERGGVWRIVFSSTVIFLAFFSKFTTWPMLTVLLFTVPAALCAGEQSRARQVFSRAASIAALSCLMIGAVIFLKYDVFAGQIRFLMDFQGPGLRRWEESLLSTFLFQVHPFITLAAIYSMYVAAKKKDIKYLVIAWLPVLVLAFQIQRIRYIVPVFPMLALTASYGLQRVKDRDVRQFIVAVAVTSSLVISLAAYLPFIRQLVTINVKEAGAFLDTLDANEALVFTITQKGEVANPAVLVPLLDLHTRKKLHYRYEPSNFPPATEIAMSKLRFTWAYKNPAYYAYDDKMLDHSTALVVISRHLDEVLPPALELKTRQYNKSRVFNATDGFYYRIAVRIYW